MNFETTRIVSFKDEKSFSNCCDHTQIFPANTTLFRQGDNFHTAYCIEKGIVKLSTHDEDGDLPPVFRPTGRGDTISLPCDPVLPR